MKKLFLLATIAMLMTSVTFANGDPKSPAKSNKKARTEKTCPKDCPKDCPKGSCQKCDKC